MKKINVAIVGLAFGGMFAQIYKEHPNVGTLTVCDTNPQLLSVIAKGLGDVKTAASFEQVLADDSIDAVHIATPIPLHTSQTLAVLGAGKHCACAVPMATSIEDMQKIIAVAEKSGKNYMMMETTLYTHQFRYAYKMLQNGEFGRIQFLRGSHYQDMEGARNYWMGLPPMWYGTHALAPIRVLAGAPFKRTVCFGAGSMGAEKLKAYGNPFPMESALFECANGIKAEATRSISETARTYQEGMFIYGSHAGFEWGFRDCDAPYITRYLDKNDLGNGINESITAAELPRDFSDLPAEIRHLEDESNFVPGDYSSYLHCTGCHHGSHPYLVHEFVSSITEGRKARIDEHLAANITAAGVCAHQSAMSGGKEIIIPEL